MTETLEMEGLTFAVVRTGRRTVGITVERDGGLVVHAPRPAPLVQVEALVRGKLTWVFDKLAEKALLSQPGPAKEYVSGAGFHYLGRSHRLLLTNDEGDGRLRLAHGRFVLERRCQPRAEALFAAWYAGHALAWLERRVALLAPRVGETPASIRVLDLGNRWGSCSADGGLNFHWRTICLPPTLIEYVVAHELVHLLEPRHDQAFWARLERVLPDCRQRKRHLAEVGARY